ncbi:hypothetical protein [Luteimicrobium subarcticum]|uniref:Uncharacterized protein n=1 Tax=Luteimicrobium subarcticum TaxID=620910 RepID=A0A2M8WSE4_9MICO|nr:hypothetical protein [Luteimicrobium subarcticum]PJI93840.1 hypothetical protein CLV34_1316 [Luteimicrobium subarcticum]
MSTEPVPSRPAADPGSEGAVEQEGAATELPAGAEVEAADVDVRDVVGSGAVRRAPKYKAFLWAGAVLGLVLGLFVGGSVLRDDAARSLDKPGVLFSVILLGGVTVGMLVAGFVAVVLDRRSVARASRGAERPDA